MYIYMYNTDGNGLAMRAWEEAYGQSQAIFDASMNDALLRNYRTVCGLNKASTLLVASGKRVQGCLALVAVKRLATLCRASELLAVQNI